MLRSTSLHQCSGRGWWLTTCRSRSPSTAVRESSEFARCPYRTPRSPAGGLSDPHVARSLRRRSASRAGRRHWPLVRRAPLAHRCGTMAGVPTHPTAPHGRKQWPDQRSLDEFPPSAIEHLRARTSRFTERSLLSGATAPPAFASLSAHMGAILRLLITACQSTSRTSRPSAAAGARLMRQ
jgi:hypothetical protein